MLKANNISPPNHRIFARSISRSLLIDLSNHSFEGRVLGVFQQACNLIEGDGRIIALTLPEVGNGPFSIVINSPALFETLQPKQSVWADAETLTVGSWSIRLSGAKIWEPHLIVSKPPLTLSPAVTKMLRLYIAWPQFLPENTMSQRIAALARTAATRLTQALKKNQDFAETVTQLAGLGQGLTPAGDDYLVGVMVALWLTGRVEIPPYIAQVAAPKTTALSAAFLRAAGRGEFIEPWQRLAQVLWTEDVEAVAQAVSDIAHFGASSGLDALAGFAMTMLG